VNHRIVSGVLAFLLLLFAGAALLFALGVRPPRGSSARASCRPAQIPHELGGAFAACRDCHRPEGGAVRLPSTHRTFRPSTCATCHPPALRGT